MAPSLQALGIDRMSVEDRIALATAIWDRIAAEPHKPLLADAQQQELKRRLADHAANPDDVVPWEQVKAEALARFKRWAFRSSSAGQRESSSTRRRTDRSNGGLASLPKP